MRLDKLTTKFQEALGDAQSLALGNDNAYIEPIHLLAAMLRQPEGPKALLPAIGRMLWLIPGHCDPTVNLHDYMIGVRGGLEHGTVERIFRVDARGALT